MRRRLPPLNAVRAFEAACRHQSFVTAADELAVTPSAVSQQVKQLEEWLGRSLFQRQPRGLVPTESARTYLPALSDALDRIDRATQELTRRPESRILTVTCLASFGAQWLTPRLCRFDARHPEIDVMLATSDRLVDLHHEDVDLAIRYTRREQPGLHVEELMKEALGVVCSPDLVEHTEHPIRSYGDLQHHTLMHDADAGRYGPLAWSIFLETVGALGGGQELGFDPERGPRFNDSHLMIQSCIAGRGVMIGRSGLVADALNSGVLVAPFGMPIPAPDSYRLAMRPGALKDPKVAAFRSWLYEELGREPPAVEPL